MTDAPRIPPLTVEFEVAASPEHAFTTWVERPGLWWPAGHTVSGSPAEIVFEPRAGGRIYERDAQGTELPWGEVLVWAPPGRIEYLWHLFFPRAEATQVAVTFTAVERGTVVRLVQTGWDALGEPGELRRERTIAAWSTITAQYRATFATTRKESR
jgi:hypothetical protein